MASTSETGHAKNVALLQNLISFCTGYGATYNPSKASIQLANLQALQTDALAKLQQVKTTAITFGKATNERQQVFKPVKTFATRVLSALAASDVKKEIVADAVTINRKIQGQRATTEKQTPPPTDPNTPPTPPSSKTISASQQSYDSLIDHYTKLIELLSQEPNYTPNEAELTVAAQNTLLTEMNTTNKAVIDAYTAYSNAIIDRDNILYNAITGLLQTVLSVKNYVKSIYGARSPQYQQLTALQFKQPGK